MNNALYVLVSPCICVQGFHLENVGALERQFHKIKFVGESIKSNVRLHTSK